MWFWVFGEEKKGGRWVEEGGLTFLHGVKEGGRGGIHHGGGHRGVRVKVGFWFGLPPGA